MLEIFWPSKGEGRATKTQRHTASNVHKINTTTWEEVGVQIETSSLDEKSE